MTKQASTTRLVTAAIHPSLVSRVTRFYDASLETVLTELFQNARRSGATAITLEPLNSPEYPTELLLHDNGSGIEDPAILLQYGANAWSHYTVHSEDAAGLGFLSLSTLGCHIASATPNGSWSMTLDPDHFRGSAPATIHTPSRLSIPAPATGTIIRFPLQPLSQSPDSPPPQQVHSIYNAAASAAQHLPIQVFFKATPDSNPEPFPQSDFCNNKHYRPFLIDDIRFGVSCTANYNYWLPPDLCFLGMLARAPFPLETDAISNTWTVRACLTALGDIRLTLPTRDTIVRNEAANRLFASARRAILTAIALSNDPRPTFEQHQFSHANGIDMPVPTPALLAWHPSTSSPQFTRPEQHDHEPLPAMPLLAPTDLSASWQQCLHRALNNTPEAPCLLHPNAHYCGFEWFDSIPFLSSDITVEYRATPRHSFQPVDYEAPPTARPHALRFCIPITLKGQNLRTLYLQTDLAFLPAIESRSNEFYDLDALRILATADTSLSPEDLTDILENSFFNHDTALDEGYDTQLRSLRNHAFRHATDALLPPDHALQKVIQQRINQDVSHLLPHDVGATIHIDRSNTNVTIHRTSPETHDN